MGGGRMCRGIVAVLPALRSSLAGARTGGGVTDRAGLVSKGGSFGIWTTLERLELPFGVTTCLGASGSRSVDAANTTLPNPAWSRAFAAPVSCSTPQLATAAVYCLL